MNAARTATWYFDFVSPFAYLQQEQFDRLPPDAAFEPTPIVLGALLAHWGQKAPAEIATKRIFTYRHAQYRADKLGIPFRMPPAHPFNPIQPLRLAIAMGNSRDAIRRIFRHIWRDGHDVASPEGFAALCDAVGFPEGVRAVDAQPVRTRCARTPIAPSRTACSACRPSSSTAICSGARTRPTCSSTARRRAHGSTRRKCGASARCPKAFADAERRPRRPPHHASRPSTRRGTASRIIAANRTSRDG